MKFQIGSISTGASTPQMYFFNPPTYFWAISGARVGPLGRSTSHWAIFISTYIRICQTVHFYQHRPTTSSALTALTNQFNFLPVQIDPSSFQQSWWFVTKRLRLRGKWESAQISTNQPVQLDPSSTISALSAQSNQFNFLTNQFKSTLLLSELMICHRAAAVGRKMRIVMRQSLVFWGREATLSGDRRDKHHPIICDYWSTFDRAKNCKD